VGERIYANRTKPFRDEDLPAIDVRVEDDSSDEMRVDSPPEYWRVAKVTIDLAVSGEPTDDFEFDQLDEIGQLIEDFMGRLDLPNLWQCEYKSFASAQATEAFRPIMVARWTYDLTYPEQSPREPDSSGLVPFQTLFAEYDLAGSSEDIEASDEVAIPQ
jgi:hypothetical protein